MKCPPLYTPEVNTWQDVIPIENESAPFWTENCPPEKRAVLENYMAECAFCRRELAALKELGPILDRLEVPEPMVGLVVWIMAEQPGSVSGPHP